MNAAFSWGFELPALHDLEELVLIEAMLIFTQTRIGGIEVELAGLDELDLGGYAHASSSRSGRGSIRGRRPRQGT